jgi:hypothetical protein
MCAAADLAGALSSRTESFGAVAILTDRSICYRVCT